MLAPGVSVTMWDVASRYIGIHELSGSRHHPLIQWWLSLCFDGKLDLPDETPWCSAFMQHPAWILRLPRSKSARARSWLLVGRPIHLRDAAPAFDVVILKRGSDDGPNVINAPGHVGLFAAQDSRVVWLLGGNQSNAVSIQGYKKADVLGVRRIHG